MSWNPDDRLASEPLKRFYSLGDLIKVAYEANDLAAATTLAKEYLALAHTYRCNWNYGNATHDANKFIGLISLKNGDREAAAAYLLKSGKSTGSPQLNSFGPDLDLANALLQDGYVEPVKTYLTDIKLFWEMDNGQVAAWLASIEEGERPTLNRFTKKAGSMEILLFGFAITWPLLVVAAFLYLLRKRIARKWLFGTTGLIAGYLALIGASWAMAYLLPTIMGSVGSSYPSLILFSFYLLVGATFVISLLVVLGVSRFFVAERRAS